MCYIAITGSAPSYLSELLHLYSPSLSLRSSSDTHAQNPTLQPQNPWLSHFLTLWPPHLEQSPPRHQALCYSLFLQKPSRDISLLRIFQLNHIALHSYQSVQYVCVCVCVCIFCIIFYLNTCRYLINMYNLYTYLFWGITFPSQYVHYVCMLVQCFEPQERCFTNFHYYYKSLSLSLQIPFNRHVVLIIWQ